MQSAQSRLDRVKRQQDLATGVLIGLYAWNIIDFFNFEEKPAEESKTNRILSYAVPGISQIKNRPLIGTALFSGFLLGGVTAVSGKREHDSWLGYYNRTSRDSIILL